MSNFLHYFKTEKQYNEHKTNDQFYLAHVDYIEETDTTKYNQTIFPLHFESEPPTINDYGGQYYSVSYIVTPDINIYSTLSKLITDVTGNRYELPEEFLNLCTFYVNDNKVDMIGKSNLDFKDGDTILLEFEHTWEPIEGYNFNYGWGVIGYLSIDGSIIIEIICEKIINFQLDSNTYTTVEGMTWREWITSKDALDFNFIIDKDNKIRVSTNDGILLYKSKEVYANDKIKNGAFYIISVLGTNPA
jgi:hypothetical protein